MSLVSESPKDLEELDIKKSKLLNMSLNENHINYSNCNKYIC